MCKSIWTVLAVTASLLISLSSSLSCVLNLSIFQRLIQRILIREEIWGIGVIFVTVCFLRKGDVILLVWYCRIEVMMNVICGVHGIGVCDSRSYSFLCIEHIESICYLMYWTFLIQGWLVFGMLEHFSSLFDDLQMLSVIISKKRSLL